MYFDDNEIVIQKLNYLMRDAFVLLYETRLGALLQNCTKPMPNLLLFCTPEPSGCVANGMASSAMKMDRSTRLYGILNGIGGSEIYGSNNRQPKSFEMQFRKSKVNYSNTLSIRTHDEWQMNCCMFCIVAASSTTTGLGIDDYKSHVH